MSMLDQEFQKKKALFDDDADFIREVRTGQAVSDRAAGAGAGGGLMMIGRGVGPERHAAAEWSEVYLAAGCMSAC